MNIDLREVTQIAAVEQTLRLDMYTGIHKALRAAMTDTLLALGRMDPDDGPEVTQVSQRVLDLLGMCLSHLGHENEFVHTAIEARAAGASEQVAHDHLEHVQHVETLRAQVTTLLKAGPAQRAGVAQELYRALALFVADNFQHMHIEETAHNAVLWSRYTDAELADIHGALVASIPPAEMMATLRWLVPFMNPAERTALLADMRAHAPEPAFAAALDVVRPHLSETEWQKLTRSLGLPAAPGLVQG